MFGLFREKRLHQIYEKLATHPDWLSEYHPTAQIPRKLTEDLYKLSNDVDTTVWLLVIWQQESIAQGMADSSELDQIVADYRNIASTADEAIRLAVEDTDEAVETAKMYCERITNMLDNGTLVGNPEVRQYCSEKLVSMMAGWIRYRLKIQAKISAS